MTTEKFDVKSNLEALEKSDVKLTDGYLKKIEEEMKAKGSLTDILSAKVEALFSEEGCCPNCGKNHRVNCGYGHRDYFGEFDCNFPWEEDYGIPVPECDDCPLTYCHQCKDDMIAKYSAIRSVVES